MRFTKSLPDGLSIRAIKRRYVNNYRWWELSGQWQRRWKNLHQEIAEDLREIYRAEKKERRQRARQARRKQA